jgi:tetratricopeptide (TPR) repeat protein
MKLTLALMAVFVLSGAQDPLAEALRKGVVQEETNQNLDAAIQAYQSVLTQFGEERKTAATALFRLAECYRKQGKNDQAMAAYRRVVAEFADQTKLAEQSRTVLAQTFKLQTPQPTSARNPQTEEARRRYRELTVARIEAARGEIDIAQKKYDLGASEMFLVTQAKSRLSELERELAEFDAGASVVEVRYRNRALLREMIGGAEHELKNAQDGFNLGKVAQLDVFGAQVKLLELQRKLAALDAGINQR